MSVTKRTAALAALCVAFAAPLAAQALNGRHQIELRVGVWNQLADVRTEIGAGGVATSVGSSGFLGGLAYGYGLGEGLVLRVSANGMVARFDTKIDGSGVSTQTGSVAELLVGVKLYVAKSTYGSSLRPFVNAGVGPVVGTQQATSVGVNVVTEQRTEVAMGGEVGGGLDILVGRHFVTSAGVVFAVMSNFDGPIGGSDNYSGPQLVLGFGYVF